MFSSPNPIIFYDGVCGLCNGFVRFVLKHDARERFRFSPLQSQLARATLRRHGADPLALESICLLLDPGHASERLESRSAAVLSVLRELGTFWRWLGSLLSIFSPRLRDWGYNLVARYRYSIFGKQQTCPIPNPKDRHRFLDMA